MSSADLFVRKVSTNLSAVFNSKGEQVSPAMAAHEAQRRIDIKRPVLMTSERACLCCNERFQSEGSHNRMCDKCRVKSAGMADYAYGR
ncbi:hypothetical protein [Marivivens aquimaris]|uniref:hypothetical protein n=1 Tax=Marivivens aquimaris TaxID=2774876 RepID=UPI00187FE092|nr:hypothetical protein [Marivivens aquimaris]